MGGGALVAGAGVAAVGGIATLAGGPMMAAGGVGGARRLAAAGANITPTLGYITWGLWGGAASLAIAGIASDGAIPGAGLLVTGLYIGSVVTGGIQLSRNAQAEYDLVVAPKRRRELALVPQGKGVALVGRF